MLVLSSSNFYPPQSLVGISRLMLLSLGPQLLASVLVAGFQNSSTLFSNLVGHPPPVFSSAPTPLLPNGLVNIFGLIISIPSSIFNIWKGMLLSVISTLLHPLIFPTIFILCIRIAEGLRLFLLVKEMAVNVRLPSQNASTMDGGASRIRGEKICQLIIVSLPLKTESFSLSCATNFSFFFFFFFEFLYERGYRGPSVSNVGKRGWNHCEGVVVTIKLYFLSLIWK